MRSLTGLVLLNLLLSFHIVVSGRVGGGGGGSRSGGFGGSSSRSSWGSSAPSSSRISSPSSSSSSWGSSSPSRAASPSSSSSWGSSSPSRVSSSSSSGTAFGSSSRVGAVASPSASGTKWGSSAPSGKPNYGAAGTSAARSSVNRPSVNAPPAAKGIGVPPVVNNRFTTVNHFGSPTGSAFGRSGFGTGSLLLAGAGGMVGGYMLGSMIASTFHHNGCCYGCGCSYYGPPPPWYYDSYIPYRYRYGQPTTNNNNNNTTIINNNYFNNGTTSSGSGNVLAADATNKKTAELCDLARWNLELPFTEMPNMILTFLSSDNISGSSIPEKSSFLYNFFNSTAQSYGRINSTANVFTIPADKDLKVCNFNIPTSGANQNASEAATNPPEANRPRMWYDGAVMNDWRQRVRNGDRSVCTIASFAKIPECDSSTPRNLTEEPFYTAVKNVVKLYSNESSDNQLITDVVQAAKHCYPMESTQIPPRETQACLDFSISSDQVLALDKPGSIFGNAEICRKLLSPDLLKCSPAGSTFPCTLTDLVNLNVFARNYYLCEEPIDTSLIPKLQERFQGSTAVEGTERKSLGLSGQMVSSAQSQTGNGGTSGAEGAIAVRGYLASVFVALLFSACFPAVI